MKFSPDSSVDLNWWGGHSCLPLSLCLLFFSRDIKGGKDRIVREISRKKVIWFSGRSLGADKNVRPTIYPRNIRHTTA
jgi:hypothetical protein